MAREQQWWNFNIINMHTMDRQQLIVSAAVLVIVAGGVGFWLGQAPERARKAESRTAGGGGVGVGVDISAGVRIDSNSIAVNDQAPGMQVMIALMTITEDAWVVIHEDRDGKPANILGAGRFNAGANLAGTVELLRPTEEGRVYYAMLHRDDGDRQFDHQKDLPVEDPQGVIVMRFVAVANPPEQ